MPDVTRSPLTLRVSRRAIATALTTLAALAVGGCGLAGAGGGGGSGAHSVALRVAIVANPQMQDVESLTKHVREAEPVIKVNYVTLPENESRAKITASVSTRSNEFDVVMIFELRDAAVGELRLDHRPAAVHRPYSRVRR